MRHLVFAAAILVALAFACSSTTEDVVPPTCERASNHIFDDCGFTSITVTDPSTGAQAQVGADGCKASCAKLDRRTAYDCILTDGAPPGGAGAGGAGSPVSCQDADHLSGCLSTF